MRFVNPPPLKAEWISVHPSQLVQFGELYGDGSDSHWFGHPMTGIPCYGDWSAKPGTIRVHTDHGDVNVPWHFATRVPQSGPQWREPEGPLPPAQPRPQPRAPEDELPRRRNPRIGCEHLDGTWIHGHPHDCPRWVRG